MKFGGKTLRVDFDLKPDFPPHSVEGKHPVGEFADAMVRQ
jgi:hypothetical protein